MSVAVRRYGTLPAALVLCLGAGVQAQAQVQRETRAQTEAATSPPAQSGGPQSSARRDGNWCYRDLSELDAHFEKNGLPARAATSADSQNAKQQFEGLREAARTLAANGRYDACRMLVYEIRAIWDHDQSPTGGTNSP